MVVQHNLHAMFTNRQLGIVNKGKGKTTERLSSGYKINRAADDAAGLSISEKMRYQIRGLDQGANNIKEGIGYCQTADGALSEVEEMIHRMNELAVKAANGTNSYTDRAFIDQEVQLLKTEMERVCETTKYNEEYIFRGKEDKSTYLYDVYDLGFAGYPDDLYIYNDSYDSVTGTAAYGGIAYHGKRYSWAGISSAMYDNTTGLFHKGTYTLKADDGTSLTLVCEEGSKPPQVSRKFTTSADRSGIYVNGEQISWSDVKTQSGEPIRDGNILNEAYYFEYHGVVASFTPEQGEDLHDVIARLSGTNWESTYRMPTEEQALYANLTGNFINFISNDEVKKYIDGDADFTTNDFTIRAGDGTNGTFDGIWLEQNGAVVAGSQKSWADVGITNWGNQSTDVWNDITYNFTYDPDTSTKADTDLSFKFQMINETSKDSVIDALDGVKLSEARSLKLDNHADLSVTTSQNVLSGKVIRDTINLTLEEEYGLGRDYTKISDSFGSAKLNYDGTNFYLGYTNTVNGVTIAKDYSNSKTQTDALVNAIKGKITKDMASYLQVITARYVAGASKPNDINLSALLTPGNITGGGGTTYLEDVVTFNPADTNLKITQNITKETSFSGAKIDFSGLGTSYQLADLIGMGFNSTCQTCNNHYSIQFTTPSIANTTWKSMTAADGNSYNYSYEKSGNDHTLYIDIDSMIGKMNDGIQFTNAVVDIINSAGYDFHYSQYATYSDNAELYVFDNRPQYVDKDSNTSTATDASFSPYAYGFNTITEFDIDLSDQNNLSENVKVRYEYDYSDLFSVDKLVIDYKADANGDYVLNPATNQYEKYDPAQHAGMQRYNIDNISLDTQGKTLDEYMSEYVRDTIFKDVADASEMGFVSEYAKYGITGHQNDNKAMVTEYNTPYQIKPKRNMGGCVNEGLRIQCSSTVPDHIYIPKQVLTLFGMGLMGAGVKTEEDARRMIQLADRALRKVSGIRSEFGAYQNRLEHAYDNVRNTAENTTASESRIRDADMALEMVNFSKGSILGQIGESMLAQANSNHNQVLSLLQ